MKQFVLMLSMAVMSISAFAIGTTAQNDWAQNIEGIAGLTADLPNLSQEAFLDLTPKKYREMTGEKLGFKRTLQLKAAQRIIQKQVRGGAADIPQAAYIVLAILALGWLAMGLMDDFQGNNWWIALILYALGLLPGIIFSLIKMGDYY